MTISEISEAQLLKQIQSQKNPFFNEYYAFYSSWFGGIIKNPSMMLVPIDDHMVHRGDGVFEAIKVVNRFVYLLDEHLNRLFASADKISINPPINLDRLKEIVLETLIVADQSDAMVRIFLSRGPGNFSVNPYDSIAPQIYIMVHKPHPLPADKYEKGVAIGKSNINIKPTWLSQVKSCNYLPNVLMKKEAIDRKLDFVFNTDDEENITECSTENLMIVDQEGVLVHPLLDYILKGTTMTRACELAENNGVTTKVKPIALQDIIRAREVMLAGTTLNILPAVRFEEQMIGDGKPGPISKKIRSLILEDIKAGQKGVFF